MLEQKELFCLWLGASFPQSMYISLGELYHLMVSYTDFLKIFFSLL